MKNSFLLIVLAFLFTACEKEETVAPVNYPPAIFSITQQPGQQLTFKFSFNAERENQLIIQKDGQLVVSKNIDAADARAPFETGFNTTGLPVTYEITHKFKTQRGKAEWLNGAGRADTISKEQIAYRFDDRDDIDADYNDAIVEVITTYK